MSDNTFQAHCHALDTSDSRQVNVELTQSRMLGFVLDEQTFHFLVSEVKISKRLGNTPRFITLPNGLRLETDSNDFVDRMIMSANHSDSSNNLLYRLEKNLTLVLVMLVLVITTATAAYLYGIPLFARIISPLVPDQVRIISSQQTLSQMDKWFLEPTALFSYEQSYYQELIEERLQPFVETPLTVEFRNSDKMGANAFALPDGTVVFTDQLLGKLNDEEFLAIAAHEAGHVIEDHGMRSVISSTSLLLIITLATGDSEAISELLVTAPTLLMQMAYSRQLETEADDQAMRLMIFANVTNEHFATGLEKIVSDHEADSSEGWWNYLSTHPEPEQRIIRFRAD